MPKGSEPSPPENKCLEVRLDLEVDSSRPDLVHARTASWIATQPAHQPWEEKYAKKMASLEGGAMSGVGVPFKATGGEMSETRNLLSAIIATHPESCPAELREEYNVMDSEQETYRSKKVSSKYSKSVLQLGDPGRFKEAGYDAIKVLLRETTEMVIAGRGGEPYMEQLEKIKKRKQDAIDEKIKADLQYPVARALSNETLRKIYRKQSLKEDDGKTGEEEEEDETVAAILEGPECSIENLRIESEFFTEKLTCILKILCSLHNLRHRHLKSRKPLHRDVVFSLRRFPFQDSQQTDSPMTANLPDLQQLTPSLRDLSAAPASQTSVALKPSGSNISVESSVSSSVASSRHLMPLSPTGSRLRIAGRVRPSAKIASQRVEVWEDLMAVENGETPGKYPPPKYRPPWQQTLTRDSLQVHLSDQKKNKKIKDTKSRIAVLTTDPALLVPNFHEFVARTREKVHRNTLQELEKLESCRLQKFQLIFHGLKSVNEIPEKYFPRMRKLLGKTKTEYTTDWYRRLGDEAESQQPSINNEALDLLKKLKQFVYHQPTDLPLHREKICLLVLSIPADELCRPAWQSALIFVMVRVLEWRLEVLKFWLSTRHLYLLQYIEEAN